MKLYEGMLPSEHINGKSGFYPVTSAEEWDNLPNVYKAMEWFPISVYNDRHKRREETVAEYIEFDVIYMEPYKIRATVRVHVQEVQKILFCLYNNKECHLYTISGVVFANGERWPAEWKQDAKTGAFAVYASGRVIGKQGGFFGHIPANIEKTENGFRWNSNYKSESRCHYEVSNPFR